MSSQQARSTKNSASESKRPADSHATEDAAEAPKTSLLNQKLTVAGHYIMLGLAPALSICALVMAVYALTEDHSAEEQLSRVKLKIDSLNLSLSATKSELEKLKAVIAQTNGLQDDVNKKQDERVTKIIQNIIPLQVKLKIFPTLEEQLRQAAATSAVPPAAASSVPAASAVAATAAKQLLPQVKVMKEAIDKYNKNN
jgi:uncharacterized protein YoxC